MLLQRGDSVGGKRHRFPSVGRADLGGKMLDQRGNIFATLAQRRQAQGKDEDAVEQVLPEFSVAHERLEIVMSGDDHPHIHGNRAVAADALDFTLLKHAQQFRLHGERHVADLIEKDGAVLRLLELAEMPRAGAR